MELRNGKNKRNIQTLPREITHMILGNLDLKSLQQLRLVSKETKRWVEQPEHLRKFCITICSSERIKKLVKSRVGWNSFTIGCDPWTWHHIFLDDNFRQFISIRGDVIKSLTCRCHKNLWGVIETLSILKNLDSLNIYSIGPDGSFRGKDICEEKLKVLASNLSGIKYLRLKKLNFNDDEVSGLNCTSFEYFLQNCPNLIFLQLPFRTQIYGEDELEVCQKYIFDPLLDYLKMRKRIGNYELLTIDFGKKTNVRLKSSTLLTIIEHCHRIDARLVHVPSTFLPKENENLSLVQQKILGECIKSISISIDRHSRTIGLENAHLYQSSGMEIEIQFLGQNFDDVDIRIQSQVKKIELIWGPRVSEWNVHLPVTGLGRQELLNELFQVYRPSLKELTIDRYFNSMETFPTGLQISNNFPNLKKLYLSHVGDTYENWDSSNGGVGVENDFNLLFRNIPNVEELYLHGCPKLTDAGLLGKHKRDPAILHAANLVNLEIVNCGITHLSFKHGFKYMKLKAFKYEVICDAILSDPEKVGFRRELLNLGSFGGGLRDTLNSLVLGLTFDVEDQLKKQIQNKFRNLTVLKTYSSCF